MTVRLAHPSNRRMSSPLMPMCTENFVGIDLMKGSLNVGQDGRADISLRDT
jgi:hypothetical protein